MQKAADWQLINDLPSHYKLNEWTYGAFYVGMRALDSIADTPKYHDAMLATGKSSTATRSPRITRTTRWWAKCVSRCLTFLRVRKL